MIEQVSICEECFDTAVEALGEETANYYVVLCKRYVEYGSVPTIFSDKGQKMIDSLEKNGYITTSEVEEGRFLKMKPNGATVLEEEGKLVLCPNCIRV